MSLSTIYSDLFVNGVLRALTLVLPNSSVADPQVIALAGIQASKLEHQYEPIFAQTFATSATVAREVLHVVKGATATLIDFSVGATTAGTGTSSVTIDLLKNGTTVLSGIVTLTASTAAFTLLAGSLASTACVAGDVLEVNVATSSAGTGAKPLGLFARLTMVEDAQ